MVGAEQSGGFLYSHGNSGYWCDSFFTKLTFGSVGPFANVLIAAEAANPTNLFGREDRCPVTAVSF